MKLCERDIGPDQPLFFIAGPCVIESRDRALAVAWQLATIADRCKVLLIYKSSFDKANRTSGSSFRGPGIDEGLEILAAVKRETGLPVLTDVHEVSQIAAVAQAVDVLQTPAFLARQTDFIRAVAACGKPVNIKKAQFMAPRDTWALASKAIAASPNPLAEVPMMLCERGTCFGYGNLVVDMRGLPVMAETGLPVIFDATHSVQLPGAQGGSSGGERQFVPTLASAAVATGCLSGVFMETHPDPASAPCDGPNAWPLDRLEELICRLQAVDVVAKAHAILP